MDMDAHDENGRGKDDQVNYPCGEDDEVNNGRKKDDEINDGCGEDDEVNYGCVEDDEVNNGCGGDRRTCQSLQEKQPFSSATSHPHMRSQRMSRS